MTARAARPPRKTIARGHVVELRLCCERIVLKYAAGIAGRDHVMAAGANRAPGGVDLLIAELLS
jgi:hypothetical protein